MIEPTELQKLKENYPDFFRETPLEVVDFVLSEETTKQITDICERNRIGNEEKVEGVAHRIALVLLGRLPKENLALTLERGVGLIAETAKKVADEANQFILSRRPPLLKSETVIPPLATSLKREPEEKPEEKSVEEFKKPPGKDVYHEPIE